MAEEGKKSDQRIRLLADRGFVELSKWRRDGTGIGRDGLIDAVRVLPAMKLIVWDLRMTINY